MSVCPGIICNVARLLVYCMLLRYMLIRQFLGHWSKLVWQMPHQDSAVHNISAISNSSSTLPQGIESPWSIPMWTPHGETPRGRCHPVQPTWAKSLADRGRPVWGGAHYPLPRLDSLVWICPISPFKICFQNFDPALNRNHINRMLICIEITSFSSGGAPWKFVEFQELGGTQGVGLFFVFLSYLSVCCSVLVCVCVCVYFVQCFLLCFRPCLFLLVCSDLFLCSVSSLLE